MLRICKFGSAPAGTHPELHGLCALYEEPHLGVSSELDSHLAMADGYIIYPHSDPLLSLSLLVAKQYNPDYAKKPVVMLHHEGALNPYIDLVRHLQAKGVVTQPEDALYQIAANAADAERIIKHSTAEHSHAVHETSAIIQYKNSAHAQPKQPAITICVIGSYSTKDPAHTELGTQIGAMLHANGWGLIYGGSDKGMMGAFAKAAKGADGRGYVQAVIPKQYLRGGIDAEMHDFIDRIDVTSDIYLRMTHMAKQSDILLAAPGGLGTAQEIAAFLRIKETDPSQKHKPLVLLNGDGFWNPMVQVLEQSGYHAGGDFIVATSLAQVEALAHTHAARGAGLCA